MPNTQQPMPAGFSEYNEPAIWQTEPDIATVCTPANQLLLDELAEMGFVWEEAIKILHLHDHLYENAEVRQRIIDDPHLQFMRWLYAQGEINEL
ncbi:MAG: hypothetical protein ABI324_13080 [Ktedonobacteraceae bacterium]